MNRPVEIHFHDVEPSEGLEEHIRQAANRLERRYHNITACVVHLEQPHRHRTTHVGYRVVLEVMVPGRGEVTVTKSSDEHEAHDNAYKVLDEAFGAMARRLQKLSDQERGHVKHHNGVAAEPEVEEEPEASESESESDPVAGEPRKA
ncbi:MAG: HPF/RaiA family ribosome-associated protein [Vulcanimicrobiota bacterium]